MKLVEDIGLKVGKGPLTVVILICLLTYKINQIKLLIFPGIFLKIGFSQLPAAGYIIFCSNTSNFSEKPYL